MVVRTERVEVPIEVVKPLPEDLTRPLAYPPALPAQFTVEDLTDLVEALYGVVDTANGDRAKAARLSSPDP